MNQLVDSQSNFLYYLIIFVFVFWGGFIFQGVELTNTQNGLNLPQANTKFTDFLKYISIKIWIQPFIQWIYKKKYDIYIHKQIISLVRGFIKNYIKEQLLMEQNFLEKWRLSQNTLMEQWREQQQQLINRSIQISTFVII